MIHEHGTNAIALLADGCTCWWGSSTDMVDPKLTDWEPISTMKICNRTSPFYALTQSGRLLKGTAVGKSLEDITDIACETLGKSELGLNCEISVHPFRVCVKVDDTLALLETNGTASNAYLFPNIINLFGCNGYRGFASTIDNKLYSVGIIIQYETGIGGYTSATKMFHEREPREMLFTETENIREIVCGTQHTLLLMCDGRVFALTTYGSHPGSTRKPFVPVVFPSNELVAKIVSNDWDIYYITTEGRCYHAGCDGVRYDRGLKPVLIRALAESFIDNVFILRNVVVVQHDSDKLCILHMKARDFVEATLNGAYLEGKRRPTRLPFFDGVCIVSVTQAHDMIFFVTSEGSVLQVAINTNIKALMNDDIIAYLNEDLQPTPHNHSSDPPDMTKLLYRITLSSKCIVSIPKAIPFFDANPCMIECNASMIRSALSITGGDA